MKKTNKLMAVMVILAMLVSYFIPLTTFADAPANNGNYAQIQFGGNPTNITNANGDATTVTVTYADGTVTVTGTDLYSDNNSVYALGAVTITAVATTPGYSANIREDGTLLDVATKTYEGLAAGNHYNIDGEFNFNSATIEIGGGPTAISGNTTAVTITYTNGTVTVAGTNLSFSNNLNGNNCYEVYALGDVTITAATTADGYTAGLTEAGNLLDSATKQYTGLVNNNFKRIDGTFYESNQGGNEVNEPGNYPHGANTQNYNGNATATLNYKITGSIEYRDGGGFENGISFRINDLPYKMDNSKVVFSEGPAYERDDNGQIILDENNQPIPLKVPGPDGQLEPMTEKTGLTITGDTIKYDNDTTTNKVNFTFVMAPNVLITNLKINNTVINNLPKTRAELSAYYNNYTLEIPVNNIDYNATGYDIEITARNQNYNELFMGNFLWDYNPQGYTGPDDKILNATLTFVEAEYNGVKYTTEAEINALGGTFNWDDAQRKKKYSEEREGVGSATFPTGTKLTVKIIPDAGYQLVDFGVNGGVFDPQEEIGTYTFEIQGGNFHLQATIAQVEDVVKTESEKVSAGNIELGGAEDSMTIGTARLDVKDIDLTEDQISNFEEAAEGYDIKNYLDISLYNTVFKGKEEESWDTQVKDLDNEATITLQLEDGVDGNEIVIVHEKHDGTYEIIPVEYDPETNTITFKTKSFSNYAIATKGTVENKDPQTPKTGDSIIGYVAVFAIATFGVITIKGKKSKVTRKH